ncbi:hypothetical protein F4679DRAFT_541465 [Xylaria curta]|nr:hypothetical protein F4679DRAFT_541465 [Xylaria curta]
MVRNIAAVCSLIDWGFAALAPIARTASLPRLYWPDHSAGIAPSPIILKDRQAYTRSFPSKTSEAALAMLLARRQRCGLSHPLLGVHLQ